LYSDGATSEKYFGQNNEKAPAAAPKKNLPITNTAKLGTRQRTDPDKTKMLV